MSKFLENLTYQSKSDNLSHAYLVFGEVDAESVVKILNIKIPDLFFLTEKPIKINHIRELIHWISLKPHSSQKRVAILGSIEEMTPEAANSLLKVLEEPPSYAVIILQASKKEKILPTILSRTEQIREKREEKKDTFENYLNVKKISSMTIKDRFGFVGEMVEDENLTKIINLWEKEYREKLLRGEDVREILREFSRVRRLLSTNTSVKLLLENLILKF